MESVYRATFASRYLIPKAERHPKSKRTRLGDHILMVLEPCAPEYVVDAEPGELCVLDMATRQKAWIETPDDMTLEDITSMIEGFFGATAFRASLRLWIVTC